MEKQNKSKTSGIEIGVVNAKVNPLSTACVIDNDDLHTGIANSIKNDTVDSSTSGNITKLNINDKKKSTNRHGITASKYAIIELILRDDISFGKLLGCQGFRILVLIVLISTFHFSVFTIYTYPSYSNLEKEGVAVFLILSMAYFVLLIYTACRWKLAAKRILKQRRGDYNKLREKMPFIAALSYVKKMYSSNFGLNGKYYLYKLYGSETMEKIFQVHNYFVLYTCRLPVEVTMLFCTLYFLDSGLQARLLYKKLRLCNNIKSNQQDYITVNERDSLINHDIAMDVFYLLFSLPLFILGKIPITVGDLLLVVLMPSISLLSKLRSSFFEVIARTLDTIILKRESTESQKSQRHRLSVSVALVIMYTHAT